MKLSDILKTSCKSFSMKFLQVNNSWNYLQYFPSKEVEQNFMKEFLMNKRKRFNTISDTKTSTVHLKYTRYFTFYARAKPKSEPTVVARLGLPDFAELMDLLILYIKRLFWVYASVLRALSSNLSVKSSRSCYLWLHVFFLTCSYLYMKVAKWSLRPRAVTANSLQLFKLSPIFPRHRSSSPPPIILLLQRGPAFSGETYITNSVYSLCTITI